MKKVSSAMLVAIVLFFSSCSRDMVTGGGTIITENRNIKNFKKIALAGSSHVTVTKGDVFNVEIKDYSNLLPYFNTSVIDGTLELGFQEHINVRQSRMEIVVTMPVLNGLAIAGSGDITSTGDFTNNSRFETEILGSGDIILVHGKAANFSGSIAGSGNIEAFSFTAEKATLEIAGSGNIKITATDKLHAKIDGSGNVYYAGSPLVSVTINGSGKVERRY
jgi:hypothetical protein